MSTKIYVVIPNLNGDRFLRNSITSLKDQIDINQVIVVDNASTDNSVEVTNASGAHAIELLRNHGFAGTVNVGIKYAIESGAEFIALFNNDAEADREWLKQLVKTMVENPKAGVVTGKFLRIDKKFIDSTGENYSSWGFPFPRGRDELDKGQYGKSEEVFGASGGASLYRVDMLKQIGLFDEDFFAYYEDVDISFRAQLAGWKVIYEPRAVAYHHVGATSSKMGSFTRYHSIKNFVYLYIKNMPTPLFWKYLPKFLMGASLIAANSLKRLQFIPLIKACCTVALKLVPMLVKRWHIQKKRRVSASYIDSMLYHDMPPTQKTLISLRKKMGLKRG